MSNKVSKTLVIGAKGFLGRHFLAAYRKIYPDTIGTDRAQLDLARPDISSLNLDGYEYALIGGAVTRIAACEMEKEATYQCNVAGTLALIRQLKAKKITPILFSTDYVFDGISGGYDETAPLRPLNEYGRQKAELQRKAIEICGDDYLLIRPSKVFSDTPGDGTLIDEMVVKLKKGETIRAARDQIFCPILATDVVESVIDLQKKGLKGIYNIGGKAMSRLDIALAVAKKIHAPLSLVQSISLDDLKENFKRPKNTSITSDKFHAAVGRTFKTVEACIENLR